MELIQINALIVFKSRECVRRHSYNIVEHLNDFPENVGKHSLWPQVV